MGQQPTEEELFQMISEVDEDMSGAIGTCCCMHTCRSFAKKCWLQILPSFFR